MSSVAGRDRRQGLPAPARALAYGVVGCLMESAFSSVVASVEARRPVPRGPSTRWMLPIYALAQPLFEPVHVAVRRRPAWQRGAVYAAGILLVEAATGEALRAITGACPWDYSGRSRFAVRGVIRLDYAPLWAVAGLAAERLHDAMAAGRRSGEGIVERQFASSPRGPDPAACSADDR